MATNDSPDLRESVEPSLIGKFVVAYDTMCTGYHCVSNEYGTHAYLYDSREEAEQDVSADAYMYDSRAEAEQNVSDNEELFVLPASEYLHGRKFIYPHGVIGRPLGPDGLLPTNPENN